MAVAGGAPAPNRYFIIRPGRGSGPPPGILRKYFFSRRDEAYPGISVLECDSLAGTFPSPSAIVFFRPSFVPLLFVNSFFDERNPRPPSEVGTRAGAELLKLSITGPGGLPFPSFRLPPRGRHPAHKAAFGSAFKQPTRAPLPLCSRAPLPARVQRARNVYALGAGLIRWKNLSRGSSRHLQIQGQIMWVKGTQRGRRSSWRL